MLARDRAIPPSPYLFVRKDSVRHPRPSRRQRGVRGQGPPKRWYSNHHATPLNILLFVQFGLCWCPRLCGIVFGRCGVIGVKAFPATVGASIRLNAPIPFLPCCSGTKHRSGLPRGGLLWTRPLSLADLGK